MLEKFTDYLPIGSVVQLLDGTQSLMIIGIRPTNKETNESYDYLAVLYPYGYIDNENCFMFNHDAINNQLFIGYNNLERERLLKALEEAEN